MRKTKTWQNDYVGVIWPFREYLAAKGLEVRDVANRFGLSLTTVHNWASRNVAPARLYKAIMVTFGPAPELFTDQTIIARRIRSPFRVSADLTEHVRRWTQDPANAKSPLVAQRMGRLPKVDHLQSRTVAEQNELIAKLRAMATPTPAGSFTNGTEGPNGATPIRLEADGQVAILVRLAGSLRDERDAALARLAEQGNHIETLTVALQGAQAEVQSLTEQLQTAQEMLTEALSAPRAASPVSAVTEASRATPPAREPEVAPPAAPAPALTPRQQVEQLLTSQNQGLMEELNRLVP